MGYGSLVIGRKSQILRSEVNWILIVERVHEVWCEPYRVKSSPISILTYDSLKL
jgi:hypothetical protein